MQELPLHVRDHGFRPAHLAQRQPRPDRAARAAAAGRCRADRKAQEAEILARIERHRRSEYRSLGIVCKTVAQELYRTLSAAGVDLTFLDYDSTEFSAGTIITSAHIAKGLEFDAVIVPDGDDTNYATEMDKCMLCIACTRAMHELHLTHAGPVSRFLEFTKEPGSRLGVVDPETAEMPDYATAARVG
ncbi:MULTISPECIES: helicase [Streptomyces]|uniref:helicase n=1 Tax=Streptomyces TaxID=1883 RepID=UPI001E65D233|nr:MULTISPECIES: helicase [Streptomyces]